MFRVFLRLEEKKIGYECYFDLRLFKRAHIPHAIIAANVTFTIETCSIKGVWVDLSEGKIDHQTGSA
jgi:hypothetical protein